MKLFIFAAVGVSALLFCGCRPAGRPKKMNESFSITTGQMEKFLKGEKTQKPVIRSKEDIFMLFGSDVVLGIAVKENRPPNQKFWGTIYTFTQQHNGLPVFASSATLQTDLKGNLLYVDFRFSEAALKISGTSRDFTPELQKKVFGNQDIHILKKTAAVWDPELTGMKGEAAMVWIVDTGSKDMQEHRYFISQKEEKIIWGYPYPQRRFGIDKGN